MDTLAWADCDQGRLTRAVEENLWSMWRNFARGGDCAFHDIHGALCLETPVKSNPYNAVMNFDGADDPSARIDKVFAHYGARGAPFVWLVTPRSTPANLCAMLEGHGLALAEVMPAMVAPLDRIPPAPAQIDPDIEITEAGPDDADELFHFISYRWDVPARYMEQAHALYRRFDVGRSHAPARAWLARRNGTVIGKSVLHLGAGVAGIHGVIVLPEARGKGLGRTLTLMALEAARAAGSDVAVLASSPMAERLYASIGFESVGAFSLYASGEGFHV